MSDKRFWAIFLGFAVLAMSVTIYFAENKEPIVIEKYAENVSNTIVDTKDETNLLVSSPRETYHDNPIKMTYYRNDDGVVIEDKGQDINAEKYTARYMQISGLKNKDIENKINSEILAAVQQEIALVTGDAGVEWIDVYVSGNFGNILSLNVWSMNSTFALNYDLSTGEKIIFDDLFINNAPVNKILTDAMFEALAFNVDYPEDDSDFYTDGKFDYDKYMQLFDMNYRDTSGYEDISYRLAYLYEEHKDELEFTISPTHVNILNINTYFKDIFGEEYQPNLVITLSKYMDYVAVYHRYYDGDIYENNNHGLEKIVFTTVMENNEWFDRLVYEISDNYVNNSILTYSEVDGPIKEKIVDWILNTTNNKLNSVLEQNKSLFFSSDSTINMFQENTINVYLFMNLAVCSNEYFANDAFYDFIELYNIDMMDTIPHFWGKHDNLDISSININATFDNNGNLIDIEENIIVFEEEMEDEVSY